MLRLRPLIVGALLLCGLGVASSCVAWPESGVGRRSFVWVSRYEYKSADDIGKIMAAAQRAGFSDVLFQVRGNGTVFYDSALEPWSETLGFQSPGFDPLGVALRQAHHRGLRLHAWINVLAGWRGDQLPKDPRQLRRAHADWFLRGPEGHQVVESGYQWLNPCLPEVRIHVAGICDEIAARYAVDGVHLDYIRFPSGNPAAHGPADARSKELFRRQTGSTELTGPRFAAWRRDCLTDLLRKVRTALHRQGRPVELSVAVHPSLQKQREQLLQDMPRWARQSMVDAVFPMNYTEDLDLFAERSRECLAAAAGRPVFMGVGSYKHLRLSPRLTQRQMEVALEAGAAGVSLYSYSSALAEPRWAAAMFRFHRGR